MKAVIIGLGRIGCGFAGQVIGDAGYKVVFVGRNPLMVDYLNRVGCYRLRLAGGSETKEIIVNGVRAVSTNNPCRVAEEISRADLIVTAVGARNLPEIAPFIAMGLRRRSVAVNVIAFENLADVGHYLSRLVACHLPADFPMERYGFSGALINRVVTQQIGDLTKDELLTFVGDPSSTFIVSGPSLRPPLPVVQDMIAVHDYRAWIRRKLYIFSAGHATCAYLGYLKGYHYIHTAIRDREVRTSVFAAMAEGQRGLTAQYGSQLAGEEGDLSEIVDRFENAALNDPIIRVGRDPRRKLAAEDRLVGAARLAEEAGIQPEKLALATAAALYFYHPTDPSAVQLQDEIDARGLDSALNQISGLDPSEGFGRTVVNVWERLSGGWRRGNLLLSLEQLLWAWS